MILSSNNSAYEVKKSIVDTWFMLCSLHLCYTQGRIIKEMKCLFGGVQTPDSTWVKFEISGFAFVICYKITILWTHKT